MVLSHILVFPDEPQSHNNSATEDPYSSSHKCRTRREPTRGTSSPTLNWRAVCFSHKVGTDRRVGRVTSHRSLPTEGAVYREWWMVSRHHSPVSSHSRVNGASYTMAVYKVRRNVLESVLFVQFSAKCVH